jgi:hypothetical protein
VNEKIFLVGRKREGIGGNLYFCSSMYNKILLNHKEILNTCREIISYVEK